MDDQLATLKEAELIDGVEIAAHEPVVKSWAHESMGRVHIEREAGMIRVGERTAKGNIPFDAREDSILQLGLPVSKTLEPREVFGVVDATQAEAVAVRSHEDLDQLSPELIDRSRSLESGDFIE